jgi:hypothetical protein
MNYLKGDNYGKRKEGVAKRFEEKLSEYSRKHRHLKFIGYCLPDISFNGKEFSKEIYFNDATFYGVVDFDSAIFSRVAKFDTATFSKAAQFSNTTFYELASFSRAAFSGVAIFFSARFSGVANFDTANFESFASFNNTKVLDKADFHGAFSITSCMIISINTYYQCYLACLRHNNIFNYPQKLSFMVRLNYR